MNRNPSTKAPEHPRTVSSKTVSVGIVGLGIMGSAMAVNLIAAGYPVVGYDVLARRRQQHRRAGGIVADSVTDLGGRASIVVTSLPSSEALLDVARDLAAAATPPRIVVETSTIAIPVKEQARKRLAARGATMLDAPLSGTGIQARNRDIVVYVGGNRAAYRRVAPILDAVARAHYHVGEFGDAMKVKFVANLLVAIHNAAAAEAVVLAMKAGLDPAMVVKVVGDGGGSSRMLQVRGPVMVKGDYSDAMMKLDVWQKDLNLIAEFARSLKSATPLFSTTVPLYRKALAEGRAAEDVGAVCAVLEKMAHYSRGRRRKSAINTRRSR